MDYESLTHMKEFSDYCRTKTVTQCKINESNMDLDYNVLGVYAEKCFNLLRVSWGQLKSFKHIFGYPPDSEVTKP